MKEKISLFETKKDQLDLATLIDTRMLICANSGGGKSYAVRKLLETTYGTQAIILDMEGEFHTLREKFDFVLIGGSNGDIPLNVKTAKMLPKTILELNVSAILDMSDLKHRERVLFVRDFLTSLIELPRNLWRPLIVVIDEAHKFAGQQELQESTFAVIDLMAQGRKRGFCGVLCSQRISKLHKDAAAEANNNLIGRTTLDIDMKRASDILGFHKNEDKLGLRDLHPGEFYVFGPAFEDSFTDVRKEKIAPVETTHPKAGALREVEISPPTLKVKGILTKLNSLPQEMEKDIKDLSEAKKRIRELEIQLKSAPKQPETQSLSDKDYTKLTNRFEQMTKSAEDAVAVAEKERSIRIQMQKKLQMIARFALEVNKVLDPELLKVTVDIPKAIRQRTAAERISAPIRPQVQPQKIIFQDGDVKYGRCEKQILAFLVNYPNEAFKRVQIAVATMYSIKSSGFQNALYKVNANGLIKKSGDRIQIADTDRALDILHGETYSKFSKDQFLGNLGKCEREISKVLMDNPDTVFSRNEIAEMSGYSTQSSGFQNALYRLNSLELVERTDNGIKLNPELLEIFEG